MEVTDGYRSETKAIARLIHYERGFYIMYEKRPETGKFRRPVYDSRSGKYKISDTDLVCLTEGLVRADMRLSKEGIDDSDA